MNMTILELADGGKITVNDVLKYINLDISVPTQESLKEDEEQEDGFIKDAKKEDHPEIPKYLCQECLDKLQSMYEFKYRCEENRDYLRNHVKELNEARELAEKAARQAIVDELQFDINNIDSLPDKLIAKEDVKTKRPRRKDPSDTAPRKKPKQAVDRSVISAEDSQVDNAIYIRKLITTPEKSPEQKSSSKRKSKHVVMEDVAVGEKPKQPRYDRNTRKKEPLCDVNNHEESNKIDQEFIEENEAIIKDEKSEPRVLFDENDAEEEDLLDEQLLLAPEDDTLKEGELEEDEMETRAQRPKRTRK